MANITAVYDACVLYPFVLRDLLMQLATTGLFRARWTRTIQQEWTDALVRAHGDDLRGKLQRVCDLMEQAVPDCLIADYETLIDGLSLPDPDDRHVLAAAIRGQADVIVTLNLADFPRHVLRAYDIEPMHPDDFIRSQAELSPHTVVEAAKTCRRRMHNPPRDAEEYIAIIRRQGLPATADFLGDWAHLI